MKVKNQLLIILLCIFLFITDFFAYPIIEVYASEGVYDPDTSWWEKFLEESSAYISYLACRIGAVTKDHDFAKWVQTREDYIEWWNTGHISKKEEANGTVQYIFDKELMAYIKQCLDEYAKENDPYFIARIPSYTEVNPSQFSTKGQYLTICNLAKKYGLIGVNGLYMSDMSEVLKGNYSYVNEIGILSESLFKSDYVVAIYDDAWERYQGAQRYKFDFPAGTSVGYESIEDGVMTGTNIEYDYHKQICPDYIQKHNGSVLNFGTPYYQYEYIRACFVAKTSMRVRVYRSIDDFKKYSVGSRKVYYTEKYYNYVPEDLKVSIDDLQKSVDDLKDVIDDLLGKIKDDTSEQEIMDLLKQILDALRDQQGSGGGGGGSGGGDVTVNVDLAETNGFLSKILAKVTQIFDKLSSITFPSMRDVVTAVEDLGKMLKKYLSEITGDLDDIKGQLENMSEQEFSDKMGNFLDDTMLEFSEVGEKAKTKFPFSIPNDINLLISKMSVSPPEGGGGESRTYNMNAADDPGGGMITLAEGDAEDVPVISETGAPIFYLPLVIESAGINEFVIVDMSGFEPISKFCRGLLTIWFVLCLYNMTFKVLGLWGDLVD